MIKKSWLIILFLAIFLKIASAATINIGEGLSENYINSKYASITEVNNWIDSNESDDLALDALQNHSVLRNDNTSWALEAVSSEIAGWITTNESDDLALDTLENHSVLRNYNTSWALESVSSEIAGWITANESDDLDIAALYNLTVIRAENTTWAAESITSEVTGWITGNMSDVSTWISGNESDDLTTATAWAGDIGGTGSSPTVVNTQGISGENITSGIVADARIDPALIRNTNASWAAEQSVQNCSEANSCGNIAYDTEVNTLIAANMSVIDGWITTNESDDINVSTQFGGEASGTYDNLVLGNDALDDQYYELTDVVGNTTAEIRSQFTDGNNITIANGVISIEMNTTDNANTTAEIQSQFTDGANITIANGVISVEMNTTDNLGGNTTAEIQSQFGAGEYINITSGVIELNMSPTVAYLNTIYRTLGDVLNATSSFGGDASGTYDAITVINTQGISGENITAGIVADARIDPALIRNINASWAAEQSVQNCSEANSCGNIAYDTEVNTLLAANMSEIDTWITTNESDDINVSTQFGGEASGTYDNLVLGNDALDDQYYELTDVVGNTTAEIQSQFGAGEYINITSGVIELNMSPLVTNLNTIYRTLGDVLNATSTFGGDVSGTYDAITVINTQGISGENITAGIVADARIDPALIRNTNSSWAAEQSVQNCSEANSCGNIAYDTEVNTLLAANMSEIDTWITTNESDDLDLATLYNLTVIRMDNTTWAVESITTEVTGWISTNESDDIDNTNTSWALASVSTEIAGWMTTNNTEIAGWINTNESDDLINNTDAVLISLNISDGTNSFVWYIQSGNLLLKKN